MLSLHGCKAVFREMSKLLMSEGAVFPQTLTKLLLKTYVDCIAGAC